MELYNLIFSRKLGVFNNVSSSGGGEGNAGNITRPL